MPDEQNYVQLARRIVGGYLRHNQVAADQLPSLISTVHQAVTQLGKPAVEAAAERTPAVSARRSVHRDYVVCMDCGWKGQMLKRHLNTAHGLSVEHHRGRWNLPVDHAMTAPAYSARRSTMAKQFGLGRPREASAGVAVAPDAATGVTPEPTMAAPPKARRSRRSRSVPASADTA